jgi:hypothetical protein
MRIFRLAAAVILLAVMNPVTTCSAQTPTSCPDVSCPSRWELFRQRLRSLFGREDCACCTTDKDIPPAPRKLCPEDGGGMLLRTGAFQLGPDVGRDLLFSQSDGKWGF